MALDQDIRDQVSAALGEDIAVDSVSVAPAGQRRVVRVTVERALADTVGDTHVEPLTLDEIADATRIVSDTLDAGDVMGSQPYTLEVTTPGTDRPLTEPQHFRRNVGRVVELTLTEGERTGRILATTTEGVDLHLKGTKKKAPHTEHIPFAQITRGLAQVEFNRPTTGDTEA